LQDSLRIRLKCLPFAYMSKRFSHRGTRWLSEIPGIGRTLRSEGNLRTEPILKFVGAREFPVFS
jgi:hypothetical protein